MFGGSLEEVAVFLSGCAALQFWFFFFVAGEEYALGDVFHEFLVVLFGPA